MELLSFQNVDSVIGVLKKEILKTQDGVYEKSNEYRQVLIQTIHTCAIKFPQVADSVVDVLMDFLTEGTKLSGAVDVVAFVKEVVERFPHLQSTITTNLLNHLPAMKSGRTIRGALWIIGEYALDEGLIQEAMEVIASCLGPLPIIDENGDVVEYGGINGNGLGGSVKSPVTGGGGGGGVKRVLADGTYASESAYSSKSPTSISSPTSNSRVPLRGLTLYSLIF
jgi:coatomer subunit beta